MNIAIIDVGSNNIKLEIHQINSQGHAELLYNDKFAARLGHEVFLTHKLATTSTNAAIEGLQQFAKIIKSFGCKRTIALGTAALREANSEKFIQQVSKEVGIKVKIISGVEEARYVYVGTLATIPFQDKTFFLNDIGGGSTEISIANSDRLEFSESLFLGTVRLKEMFLSKVDPQVETKKSIKAQEKNFSMMESYVDKVMQKYLLEINSKNVDMGLSTGGTARNIAEIIKLHLGKQEVVQGISIIYTDDLKKLVSEMKQMSHKELSKLEGLDSARVDIILPGAIILLRILQNARIKKSFISPKGLRDGILVDYISRKVNKGNLQTRQRNYRFYSVEKLSQKFNLEKEHAKQCAFLTVEIFELLKDQLNLASDYRDILYSAALLHDIGTSIDYVDHQRHTKYLIMNSEIFGFSTTEKYQIALIACYHRKGTPKFKDFCYLELKKKQKKMIKKLAAILRIADALDRSYTSAVKKVTLGSSTSEQITLLISGKKDLSLELWSIQKKKKLFEQQFKLELNIVA